MPTVGLFQPMFEDSTFRYVFAITSIAMSVVSFVEMYYIMKGEKWFDYRMPKEMMLIDMAEPHGPEAVAPVLHRYLERFGFAPLELYVRRHVPHHVPRFGMKSHPHNNANAVVDVGELGPEAQNGVVVSSAT